MNIEENESRISIEASLVEGIFMFFAKSFQGFFLVAILISGIVIQANGVLDYAIALFVILLGWEIASLLVGVTEVFHCRIDKESKTIKLTKRNPATFWMPNKNSYKFQDIKSIIFGNNDDSEKRLMLSFRNGERAMLAGSMPIKTAETISTALHIPLHIQFGNERITHVPWTPDVNADLVPTPCLSCGAPLPKIEHKVSNIKCVHCGMSMIIQWGDGKFSYMKEIG